MLYLDLLMALAIVLALAFGMDALSPRGLVLGLAAGVGGLVIFHFVLEWLLGWVGRILTGSGERGVLPSRRRIIRAGEMRTRAEQRLEAMDEAVLRAWIEAHPADLLASEILCERLRAAGQWGELARELHCLLTLPGAGAGAMSIEERCSHYHRLADVYGNRLGRPDRAREVLNAMIAEYPCHYQATLARERLRWLEAGGGDPPGEEKKKTD